MDARRTRQHGDVGSVIDDEQGFHSLRFGPDGFAPPEILTTRRPRRSHLKEPRATRETCACQVRHGPAEADGGGSIHDGVKWR